MNLILEYDDFHFLKPYNCLDSIYILKNNFPDIKISLFTSIMMEGVNFFSDEKFLKEVKNLLDSNNIRLAVHGFYHTQEEFKHISEGEALNKLSTVDYYFKKFSIPYVKIFRGPHWGINENTINILNYLNYTHLYNHIDYKHLESRFKNKVIYYNCNLKDDIVPSDVMVAHGHTHNVCGNGIQETLSKVVDFVSKNKNQLIFKFVDEI